MSVTESVQIYADAQGASHLQNWQVELTATDYAPPAPTLNVSAIEPADGYSFARLAVS